MSDYEYHDSDDDIVIEGDIVVETDKAWLVDTGQEKVWLPKSQCSYENGSFLVPYWLARKKGLA